MDSIRKEELPFSRLHHVCIVVKDLEKAKKHYESLGIGPFTAPVKPAGLTEEMKRKTKYKEIFGQMGPIGLQLTEPSAEHDDDFKKFLDAHGEGVHHFCFICDDIKKDVDDLVNKGFELINSRYFPTGGGEAMFNFDYSGDPQGVRFQLLDKIQVAELEQKMLINKE
jgi:catechol 2,3-dioxygenase-like lactoylglutathione lyase family enzyme